jgi:hypothetical protein
MDLTGATWRKSSFSGGNGGTCVEIAFVPGPDKSSGRVVAVRDSKNPGGSVLTFAPAEWAAFTLGVQHREFDLA